MKLISNYKDYYDFIQGIHGIDPLTTYERHFQSIKSVHNSVKDRWEKISLNHQPKLNHFHKIIEPQTLFISIAQFLTRQAVIEDKRSDVEKLQAFGFDKITSFRNM